MINAMAQFVGILPSAARIDNVTGTDIVVADKFRAAHVVVDVTAGTGFNLIFTIKGKDKASEKDYTILASPTINATGTTVMRVGPELTAGANIAKDYIPYVFHVDVTQSGGVSATYSIGASLI
jgi:hypothetical protein